MSKGLEKIMYNCLIKFLDKNDILYEKQCGFKSKHSTVDALIEITENIRSGTEEEYTSIMLDLRKSLIILIITDYWKNCHNAVSGEL